jgi:hypothetical protein
MMEVHIVNNNIMIAKEMDKTQLLFSKDLHLFIIGKWLMQKLKKMVLIDQFTGSKKSQDKKMVQ